MTAYNATMYNKETFNNIDRVIGIVTRRGGGWRFKGGCKSIVVFPQTSFYQK